ncbi:MAG: redoxin domain-containing protein [bacterium]|nr:redoxin domain-containing protein [bacterium]
MHGLQTRIDEFRALDAEIVAVSMDSPEESAEIVEAYDLEFPIVSDPDAKWIEAFDVLHVNGGMTGDIARPATFILDRDGEVVWLHAPENWRIRVRPQEILDRLSDPAQARQQPSGS